MAKVNTYGINIKGLKKASGATMNYGAYSGKYDELFFDKASGKVWTVFQCSLGQNSWTEYHDSNVIKLGNITEHLTMQQIADMIREAVSNVA